MNFPRTIDEITPEWLTQVLRDSGAIEQARVKSFATEVIVGGVSGSTTRLKLAYAADGDVGPASVVAKQAVRDDDRRKYLDSLGYHEREVELYRFFGPDAEQRLPNTYFTEYDSQSGHFLILMEDLGHLRFLDRKGNSNFEDAQVALSYLARIHSRWWGKIDSKHRPWMIDYSDPEAFGSIRSAITPLLEPILEVANLYLPPEFEQIFRRFVSRYTQIWQRLGEGKLTFTHGDFNIGNIIYDDTQSGWRKIIPVDWQLFGRSRPGVDVAVLVGTAFDTDSRRPIEDRLLRGYHEELVENGVSDYSWDEFVDDFRLGLLLRLGMLPRALVRGGFPGLPETKEFHQKICNRLQVVVDWNCDEVIPK